MATHQLCFYVCLKLHTEGKKKRFSKLSVLVPQQFTREESHNSLIESLLDQLYEKKFRM